MPFLIVLALVIIGLLAAYAWRLTRQVQVQEAEKIQRNADLLEQIERQRLENNRSIQIIAQGFMQNQVTATEASIRIRGLLLLLEVDESIQEEFKAFFLLADATQHIPILDAWNALSRDEQRGFDKQRLQLETMHREFVEDATGRILGRTF